MGSIWILLLTTFIAFPVGVAAGVYLEEYAKKIRLSALLEINISNLAGVPSIIYGLLGLEVFVRFLGLGASVLAGALTLSLLILPIIIVATREAIKAVPNSIRDASFALGASKWQTLRNQILPASCGGILTGIILALSRAVGETAPLIVVGALAYVPFAPSTPYGCIFSITNSNIQLDIAPSTRIYGKCRSRNYYFIINYLCYEWNSSLFQK